MRFGLYKTLWGAVGQGTGYDGFADVLPAVAAEGWDGVAFAFIAHEFDDGLGTDAELANQFSEWQFHREQIDDYPNDDEINALKDSWIKTTEQS